MVCPEYARYAIALLAALPLCCLVLWPVTCAVRAYSLRHAPTSTEVSTDGASQSLLYYVVVAVVLYHFSTVCPEKKRPNYFFVISSIKLVEILLSPPPLKTGRRIRSVINNSASHCSMLLKCGTMMQCGFTEAAELWTSTSGRQIKDAQNWRWWKRYNSAADCSSLLKFGTCLHCGSRRPRCNPRWRMTFWELGYFLAFLGFRDSKISWQ